MKLGGRIGGVEPCRGGGSGTAAWITCFPVSQFPHRGDGYRNNSHSPLRLSAHDKLVALLPSQSCYPYPRALHLLHLSQGPGLQTWLTDYLAVLGPFVADLRSPK